MLADGYLFVEVGMCISHGVLKDEVLNQSITSLDYRSYKGPCYSAPSIRLQRSVIAPSVGVVARVSSVKC